MARKTATLPATAVEPELREALDGIAAGDDVSLGHVIRQACAAYVQTRIATSAPVRKVGATRRAPKAAPSVRKNGPEGAEDIAAFFRRRNGGQQ